MFNRLPSPAVRKTCRCRKPRDSLANMADRETLVTEFSAATLSALRSLAREEGAQLQALDEALADLIEKRKLVRPRPHVMVAYMANHDKYAELYGGLA